MSDQTSEKKSNRSRKMTGERLNFILAVCAILISAASFYATYLQATSAEKQVKAMTYPLIQFAHGNTQGGEEKNISFSLLNAGLGPAIIKSIQFTHNGQQHDNFFQLLNQCCQPAVKAYLDAQKTPNRDLPQFITSPVVNSIVGGQDRLTFFQFKHVADNHSLWEMINRIRFEMTFSVCYCSMLDDCFESNGPSEITPVKQCD